MLGLVSLAMMAVATANASQAQERSLKLYNMNTRESLEVVFKRDGKYVDEGVKALDRFLRDWRRNETVKMDRRLYDVVWEVYQRSGASAPIHVHSGYRSPTTNASLRARSSAVARHSQHMKGTAMDFHIPGVSAKKLQEIALVMEGGGVGFYPKANNPFVHVDVGDVRHWPRLPRQQLAKLFPDGVTAHLPADGKPLSRIGNAIASASAKAAHAVAALVPKQVPLPSFRPVEDENEAFEMPQIAAIPVPEDQAYFPITAYVPRANPAISALDRMLAPVAQDAASMKVERRPLQDAVASSTVKTVEPPRPELVDLGVGKKGPRLKSSKARPASSSWKIQGYL